MENIPFLQGYKAGLTGQYAPGEHSRFEIDHTITEDDIVGIIQNLTEIALEHWLHDDLLHHDAGLIMGWVERSVSQAGTWKHRNI